MNEDARHVLRQMRPAAFILSVAMGFLLWRLYLLLTS
jgi:hypothetical protein